MVQRQLSRVYHICQSVSFVAGPRRAQQHSSRSSCPVSSTSDFTSTPLADHPGQKVYSTSQTRIQNLKSYKDTSVHRCDYTPYCSSYPGRGSTRVPRPRPLWRRAIRACILLPSPGGRRAIAALPRPPHPPPSPRPSLLSSCRPSLRSFFTPLVSSFTAHHQASSHVGRPRRAAYEASRAPRRARAWCARK
jgi:hypothetical protein